jgi:hypothetical protein
MVPSSVPAVYGINAISVQKSIRQRRIGPVACLFRGHSTPMAAVARDFSPAIGLMIENPDWS